ncbi:MAG: mechanosensitive ion channel domain-containing protein [Sphingomonas sp.]
MRLLAPILLIAGASPAFAQNVARPEQASPPAIETRVSAEGDAEIAGRIRSIFGQIPALRGVDVRASAGVVTLSGSVPDAADVERAATIASRVAGVVTVENGLTRDLAVDSNLAPALGNLREDLQHVVRALPLMGVAAAVAVLIGLLGYLIAGRKRLWRAVTPNVFLAELVATSIRFVFVLIGIVAALEILGATALLGAVLGGAGVVGIALGFAVRDTIDNYVSSLMLSLRQPFRANDHVVIEGHEGRVVRLTSRATILMTLDGNHLRIPNSTVFKAVILNYTRNPERRFEFDLGVDADDDPIQGMAVGLAAVNALPFVLDAPQATAIVQDVGDSNIVLRFFGWIDQADTDFLKGRSLAIQAAKSALEDAGFALPEPIYRLRFDQGTPLPLAGMGAKEGDRRQPAARSRNAPPRDHDTAPEAHVEQLVREERAEEFTEDLLDDRRPVE